MKLKPAHVPIVLFNACYLVPFFIYYLSRWNYEFLIYIGVVFFFFFVIFATLPKTHLPPLILWGLSIWGFLHMAGGGIRVNGAVLYDLLLVPLVSRGEIHILAYDQLVHFFGFGVTTLVGYHLLRPYLNEKTNWRILYLVLFAFGMGMGALNEVVEFFVVCAVPQSGVGGYVNTGLDLVFNLLGAATALVVIRSVEAGRKTAGERAGA